MEDILYLKVEQNIPVTKRELTLKDVATLYSVNKSMVHLIHLFLVRSHLDLDRRRVIFDIPPFKMVVENAGRPAAHPHRFCGREADRNDHSILCVTGKCFTKRSAILPAVPPRMIATS